MAARHAPLLAAAALLAVCASGPATAEHPRSTATEGGLYGVRDADVSPVRVPSASADDLPVDVDRLVKAPQGKVPARPRDVPGVSVRTTPRPRKTAPKPRVSVPGVSIYDDAVCVDVPGSSVHVGDCRPSTPRAAPRPRTPSRAPAPARAVRVPAPTVTPTVTPTATPTPTPSPSAVRARAVRPAPPPRRESPLGTVLLMVVLTTVIASTTAVAFGAIR